MTVVQSFVCGNFYKKAPAYADLPANAADLIIEAISYNTARTSLVMVGNI